MSGIMFQSSVGTYRHALSVLDSILRKGEARAVEVGLALGKRNFLFPQDGRVG